MISDKILVADKGNACDGLERALDMVKETALYTGFNDVDAENLKKLVEEMIAGSAAILDFFLERYGWKQMKGCLISSS